ncbi:DsbA family oxidoreductase [Streptomyces viridiviolaceus]
MTAPAQATAADESDVAPSVSDGPQLCAVGTSPAAVPVDAARIAAEEGFGPAWGPAWRSSSHDAHGLAFLAYEHGGSALQHRIVEQVMQAHFLDGSDVSDLQLLNDIAARSGFPEAAELLDDGAGDRVTRELLVIGRARSIRTSPTFLVGGWSLVGAQPAEAIIGAWVEKRKPGSVLGYEP